MRKGEIIIKTPEQIAGIARAGALTARLFDELKGYIRPGVTTLQIDAFADRFIKKNGGKATFKSVENYHHATCISLNNEVVHAIPRKERIVQRGDIVKVDCGVTLDGFIGDRTMTYLMPGVSDAARRLVEVTRECLAIGIRQMLVGNRIGDIGAAIQEYAESNGYAVVKEYVGHGTGIHLHEEPSVPHFGNRGEGVLLREGMVLAIEPMINEIGDGCRVLPDGWTVVTEDGGLSAQFEHTVAITVQGPRILTEG